MPPSPRRRTTCTRVGVTSWQDALVGELFGIPDCYDVYAAATEKPRCSVSRVTGDLFWVPGRDLADAGEGSSTAAPAATGGSAPPR